MRKAMKKTLSLLLAVCMMIGFVPVMTVPTLAADATVSYGNSVSVSASKGTIENDVLTLPNAAAGYTASDYAVTLTFTNIYGSNNTIMVYGDDPDTLGFTIDPQGTSSSSGGVDFVDETIPASGSRTLTITPKSGLSAGEYRYEFLILASGGGVADQDFTVSFTVTGDGGGTTPDYTLTLAFGGIDFTKGADGAAVGKSLTGFSYNSSTSTLTLTDFDFTTTAATAMSIKKNITIELANSNSITGGDGNSNTSTWGINSDANITFKGTGTLTATGGESSYTNGSSIGIQAANITMTETAKLIGSTTANENVQQTRGVNCATLTVASGNEVTGTGANAKDNSYGVYVTTIVMTGGTITGTSGTVTGTSAAIRAGSEPTGVVVKSSDDNTTYTHDSTSKTYGSNGTPATSAVMTVAPVITPDYTIVIRADGTVTKGDAAGAEAFTAEGFSYNSSSKTLTLNNFEFTTTAIKGLALQDDVTIVLSGKNAFTSGDTADQLTDSYGIVSDANLTIKGTGSLTATAGKSPRGSIGIAVTGGTLAIEGGTVMGVGTDCDTGSAASVGIDAKSTSVTGGKLIGQAGTGYYSIALVSLNSIKNANIIGRTGETGGLVTLVHNYTTPWSYGLNDKGDHTHAIYAEVTPKTVTTPPSGGGGGGSTGGTTTIPADTENKSTQVDISTSGNDVTLKLPDSKVEDIIKSADENVTFDLSKVKNAETAIIPVKAVETLSEGNVGITVKLPEAEITIAASNLTDLVEDAKSTEDLRVEAEYISPSDLTAAQKEAVEGKRVIDINVFLGARKVDVPVTVSVPYELGENEDPAGVCVWYMDDKGNLSKMTGSYDTKTGLFTFYTDHQSYYLIGYEEVETHLCDAFNDIKSHWGFDAICYMVENSVMNGTSSTSFEPNVKLSRAMMVQILYNLESKPAAGSAAFTDVASGAWYADAVAWASAKGIVNGYGNDLFGPEDSITREQMVTILRNYAEFKGMDVSATNDLGSFGDSSAVSAWALNSIQWAVEEAIISGKPGGLLDPQGTATRAEIAQMMMNFMAK